MAERQSSTVKTTNDNEWEDVSSEWEDVASSNMPPLEDDIEKPDQPWYLDTFDFLKDAGTGFAKGAGQIATTPSRLLTDLGVPGYKDQDYSYLEPKGATQQFTSGLAESVPYVVGGGVEGAIAKSLPAMSRTMTALGKGVIGAGGGATANYATGEDPRAGAIFGGATPLAFSAFQKPLSWARNKLRQSSLYNMGKAVGANYLNRGRNYVEKNILQPLMDRGEMFWSLRDLENRMRKSAETAMSGRDAIRSQYPADLSIPYGEVENAMSNAQQKFRTIVDPSSGITTPSGSRDIDKIRYINDELTPEIQKTTLPPQFKQGLRDVPGSKIYSGPYGQALRNAAPPPTSTTPVLFDTLEDFKQDWAGFARQHGKYQGKKMVGQVPESTVEVEAKFEAANEIRELLKKHIPDEWDQMNRRFHIDMQIADLAEARDLARMGNPTPMAETVLGEVPSAYPGRALARTYQKVIRSPAFQSSVAQLKNAIGKNLVGAQGFKSGQALSFLDAILRGPDVSVTATNDPENTYDPSSENVAPFLAPESRDLEWDEATQTFKPAK